MAERRGGSARASGDSCVHLQAFELTRELFTCPVVNIRLHADTTRIFGCNQHESRSPDGDGQQGAQGHTDTGDIAGDVARTAFAGGREAGSEPADSHPPIAERPQPQEERTDGIHHVSEVRDEDVSHGAQYREHVLVRHLQEVDAVSASAEQLGHRHHDIMTKQQHPVPEVARAVRPPPRSENDIENGKCICTAAEIALFRSPDPLCRATTHARAARPQPQEERTDEQTSREAPKRNMDGREDSGRENAQRRMDSANEVARAVRLQEPPAWIEQQLRSEWWLNHGCPWRALYGDDGEMQCNALGCMKDFKHEPLEQLWEYVSQRRSHRVTTTTTPPAPPVAVRPPETE
jgi:hypothetical protein